MRVGWLIPTVGTFGAVREMVEVSNVLVHRGHDVTIYHPDGKPCVWLNCLTNYGKVEDLRHAPLDVLIGIVDWQPDLYAALKHSRAKVKAVCLMGFSPNEDMAAALRGDRSGDKAQRMIRDAIESDMLILADSSWQLKWVAEQTKAKIGVPFGGVNLGMFRPPATRTKRSFLRVIGSGDPRSRKGNDMVQAAMHILKENGMPVECDTYWGKRYTQKQLVQFYQSGDIFLDGHRRGGWCNPVAEAMACGTPVVCTDIGAVSDFAIHEETALLVPVDDADAMAQAAMRLLGDEDLRNRLAANGLDRIRQFSYERVVPKLEACLKERLHG